MDAEIRVQAHRDDFHEFVFLRIYRVNLVSHTAEAMKTDQFEPASNGAYIYSDVPHVTFTNAEAQRLTDQLWSLGFRPTEGAGSAGAMAAKEAHLKDLQNLVDWLEKRVEYGDVPAFVSLGERRER